MGTQNRPRKGDHVDFETLPGSRSMPGHGTAEAYPEEPTITLIYKKCEPGIAGFCSVVLDIGKVLFLLMVHV
jgi:hypothetical protein